jgi:hypothetical protein
MTFRGKKVILYACQKIDEWGYVVYNVNPYSLKLLPLAPYLDQED